MADETVAETLVGLADRQTEGTTLGQAVDFCDQACGPRISSISRFHSGGTEWWWIPK